MCSLNSEFDGLCPSDYWSFLALLVISHVIVVFAASQSEDYPEQQVVDKASGKP